MSQSGSAMTLSSSASQGIAPAGGKTESAMPKTSTDQWSDGSSAGGSRGGAESFHEAIKRFGEPSVGSGSMNDDCQALSSSDNASMTKEEVYGPHGPPTALHRRIAERPKPRLIASYRRCLTLSRLLAWAGPRRLHHRIRGPQSCRQCLPL